MNWIQSLYQTYENCLVKVGDLGDEGQVPLLPICHTTQKAQIEITLSPFGDFRRAQVVPKSASRTIIPCTEKSAGRTSGEAPHPLCDKLQYLAADYKKYGGDKDHYFESYLSLLFSWVNFGVPEKVKAIYEYVRKGQVIGGLITSSVLFTNQKGTLYFERPETMVEDRALDIFHVLPGVYSNSGKLSSWQADAFVRWRVEDGSESTAVWEDTSVFQSWIEYYSSTKHNESICYITGVKSLTADQHPAKIRNDADKAKLISSGKSVNNSGKITIDDSCGFTFLGRFTFPDQVASVGFETSQKAHFALRWLMSRQGYIKGDLAVVAWATSGKNTIQPLDDTFDAYFKGMTKEIERAIDTAQDTGISLRKKIAGYRQEINERDDVIVMAVDSATPGRLSIVYYQALKGSDFLDRIENWHESCSWRHTYRTIDQIDQSGKNKKLVIPFSGAPAPVDIAEVAYGRRVDDKLKKATIKRILPCIIDGSPLPRDLVDSVVRRASNREGLKNPEDKKYYGDPEFLWKKTLTIACALFKKYKEGKEKFEMSLDEKRKTRDYLYGRLLAVADILEERALYKAKEKRATNAARFMQQFSLRPFQTWKQIHEALIPYMVRLGGANYYKNLIGEIINLNPECFEGNKPLTGEYLLGFYSQRQKLIEKSDAEEVVDTVDGSNQ